MQFYLNGYSPGDPDIQAAAPGAEARPADLPDTTDVLIVGTGPAGMLLAAQLSAFPGITTRIVDRREGPLQVGQADGVACRTVEMFDAVTVGAMVEMYDAEAGDGDVDVGAQAEAFTVASSSK